jgi:hypothetical protein
MGGIRRGGRLLIPITLSLQHSAAAGKRVIHSEMRGFRLLVNLENLISLMR